MSDQGVGALWWEPLSDKNGMGASIAPVSGRDDNLIKDLTIIAPPRPSLPLPSPS